MNIEYIETQEITAQAWDEAEFDKWIDSLKPDGFEPIRVEFELRDYSTRPQFNFF